MRRTIISAVCGVALAGAVIFTADFIRDLQAASRFASIQQQAPSEWLMIEGFAAREAVYPAEPRIHFVGTPTHDMLVRVAVSSRNADDGNVLCSGGGATVLYPAGIPVSVSTEVSTLAGLDDCDWPIGRYRLRLTFTMTEQTSQITKTLLLETEDVEVISAASAQ
ncbi:hypothetical protein [Devosia sp. 919]|uniref:hypothetical protein n=1 Tax=Devosia sp. 919 TaxID=2726065 RepID=UPI001554A68D|nr:hypothetical protein [Devosia sp. 919]